MAVAAEVGRLARPRAVEVRRPSACRALCCGTVAPVACCVLDWESRPRRRCAAMVWRCRCRRCWCLLLAMLWPVGLDQSNLRCPPL